MSVYLPVAVKDLLGNVSEEKINDVSAWINSCSFLAGCLAALHGAFICDKIGPFKICCIVYRFALVYLLLTGIIIFLVFSKYVQVHYQVLE